VAHKSGGTTWTESRPEPSTPALSSPARDFGRSKAFYKALGFPNVLDGEVAIVGAGSGGFIFQNYYQKDWDENFMMQLMVDDLDAWWAFIEGLDLPGRFGVQPPRPRPCSRGGSGRPTSSTRPRLRAAARGGAGSSDDVIRPGRTAILVRLPTT
jgi:hypothetical protein